MSEPTPPGGFPLRWAITALAEGEGGSAWTEFYEDAWRRQDGRGLEEGARHLWLRLLDRARRDEVVFVAVKQGSDTPAKIGAALLRGGRPDYVADTLEAAGATYHAVSVFRSTDPEWSGSTPANPAQTALMPQPGPTRTQFANTDEKLRSEWEAMVGSGKPPFTAARLLAPKAEGGGSEESKAKRLYRRFTQSKSSTQF